MAAQSERGFFQQQRPGVERCQSVRTCQRHNARGMNGKRCNRDSKQQRPPTVKPARAFAPALSGTSGGAASLLPGTIGADSHAKRIPAPDCAWPQKVATSPWRYRALHNQVAASRKSWRPRLEFFTNYTPVRLHWTPQAHACDFGVPAGEALRNRRHAKKENRKCGLYRLCAQR